MASNKTVVKGIRASQEFFDKCDLVAKAENVDRNKLIVRIVGEYCEKSNVQTVSYINSRYCYKKENENVKDKR